MQQRKRQGQVQSFRVNINILIFPVDTSNDHLTSAKVGKRRLGSASPIDFWIEPNQLNPQSHSPFTPPASKPPSPQSSKCPWNAASVNTPIKTPNVDSEKHKSVFPCCRNRTFCSWISNPVTIGCVNFATPKTSNWWKNRRPEPISNLTYKGRHPTSARPRTYKVALYGTTFCLENP